MTDRVSVPRADLEFMATFQCEHEVPCKDAEDRGAACNSCWVVFFAKQWLERTEAGEEYVERSLRCPRCMGDGYTYQDVPVGAPRKLSDDPCPDCAGEGEINVDVALSVYLERAAAHKIRADQAEAILKRLARAKNPGGFGVQDEAAMQRLYRIESAARNLVLRLKNKDTAPLQWALMGGDPDAADGGMDT